MPVLDKPALLLKALETYVKGYMLLIRACHAAGLPRCWYSTKYGALPLKYSHLFYSLQRALLVELLRNTGVS